MVGGVALKGMATTSLELDNERNGLWDLGRCFRLWKEEENRWGRSICKR